MKSLRPFPFPLNVGTDICQISRIYSIVSGPQRTRFINKILAPEERGRKEVQPAEESLQNVCMSNGPNPGNKLDEAKNTEHRDPAIWKTAVFLAGRFAAKEAAIKAHPLRHLTFHDVVIERLAQSGERLGSGPPVARIKGEDEASEDTTALISISHDGDYATAVCIGHTASQSQRTE